MNKYLSTALFTLFAFSSTKLNAQKADPVITSKQLEKIAEKATPAIQMAYYDGKNVIHHNYGVKNAETQEAIDSQTIFQAASLSKVVATYAFLVLVDKGLLDLDKPLWSYYPYDRLKNDPNKELMTARHVLTHATGLVNWVAPAGSNAWKKSELKTKFVPGTDYLYSGEAYHYLQLVAEKITGKSLDEMSIEYIFQPFGMTKSRFVYHDAMGDNFARGHKGDLSLGGNNGRFKNANSAYTLLTTADEYMKFVIEGVINGKGLSKKMHNDFLTPKVSTAAKGKEKEKDKHVKCCFGIRSQENEAGTAYWHTGSNGSATGGGYKCVFLVYPTTKKAVVVMTNSAKGTGVYEPIFKQVFGKDQTYWLTHR
jgi:CubicO group peptidase (beta-lactamase class C family)